MPDSRRRETLRKVKRMTNGGIRYHSEQTDDSCFPASRILSRNNEARRVVKIARRRSKGKRTASIHDLSEVEQTYERLDLEFDLYMRLLEAHGVHKFGGGFESWGSAADISDVDACTCNEMVNIPALTGLGGSGRLGALRVPQELRTERAQVREGRVGSETARCCPMRLFPHREQSIPRRGPDALY